MAYSQSDLDALNTAIASSELSVEYQGRKVTFRSIEELKRAVEHVKGELASQATPRTGAYRFTFTTQRD